MEIGFDPAKRKRNLAKHGLDLADAGALIEGPCLTLLDERFDYGEERLVSVGWLRDDVAVCVWVEWGDMARVMRRWVHPPDEP